MVLASFAWRLAVPSKASDSDGSQPVGPSLPDEEPENASQDPSAGPQDLSELLRRVEECEVDPTDVSDWLAQARRVAEAIPPPQGFVTIHDYSNDVVDELHTVAMDSRRPWKYMSSVSPLSKVLRGLEDTLSLESPELSAGDGRDDVSGAQKALEPHGDCGLGKEKGGSCSAVKGLKRKRDEDEDDEGGSPHTKYVRAE